jgi:hypothetical protein
MFFRAAVHAAIVDGYAQAGFHLAIHLRDIVGGEVDDETIGQLDRLLGEPDAADRLWIWLRATLPRCMALVHRRRKRSFLQGVQHAIDEKRV